MFKRVSSGVKRQREQTKRLHATARNLGPGFAVIDDKWLVTRRPVNLPVDLDSSVFPDGWKYGDIVTLGSKENPARDRRTGAPISPMQQFRLVQAVAATEAEGCELPV